MMHEFNCPDKNNSLKCCMYNPSHKYLFSEISKHEMTCTDKPKDDPIDNDIRDYIKKAKQNQLKAEESQKENKRPIRQKEIPGLSNNSQKDKKKTYKELEKQFFGDDNESNLENSVSDSIRNKIDEVDEKFSKEEDFNINSMSMISSKFDYDPNESEYKIRENNFNDFYNINEVEVDNDQNEYSNYSGKNCIPINRGGFFHYSNSKPSISSYYQDGIITEDDNEFIANINKFN